MGRPLGRLAGVLSAAVAALGALLTVRWDPGVLTEGPKYNSQPTAATGDLDTPKYIRRTITFPSHGESLEVWLYTPTPTFTSTNPSANPTRPPAPPPPVVIMAHGLGGQKDMGLHRFAERFALRGLAALVFDYRCFGGSTGMPRNWVSPKRHVEDWTAAVEFVQSGALAGKVDPAKVALWGTSFSGGHVLVTAAKRAGNVSAVVSQVPHLSGLEGTKNVIKKRGVLGALRLLLAGIQDKARAAAGLAPRYIKMYGLKSELAINQLSPEELAVYFSRHPKVYQGGWENKALARMTTEGSRYSPIQFIEQVKAPVLMFAAENDSLCPAHVCHRAVELNSRVRLISLKCGHFEVYRGDTFEEGVSQQCNFFEEHLLGGKPAVL